ncbi:unnamed protein product [Rhizophagus irregularis]|nr:unnamed protein product [Rhizophagus irregularis]
MDLDKSEYNQSINDNSQENDSEITRLQARLSKSEEDLATLRTENERLKKVQTDYVDICKENDKLKTQLENEKNNKQTSHSEVFADDKAQQLKELRKILSTLRSDKEKLTNKLTESEKNLEKTLDENKKLKDKISATSKNLDNYSEIQNENKVQLKQFEDKLKEKSYNQLVTDIKVKNGEIRDK